MTFQIAILEPEKGSFSWPCCGTAALTLSRILGFVMTRQHLGLFASAILGVSVPMDFIGIYTSRTRWDDTRMISDVSASFAAFIIHKLGHKRIYIFFFRLFLFLCSYVGPAPVDHISARYLVTSWVIRIQSLGRSSLPKRNDIFSDEWNIFVGWYIFLRFLVLR